MVVEHQVEWSENLLFFYGNGVVGSTHWLLSSVSQKRGWCYCIEKMGWHPLWLFV